MGESPADDDAPRPDAMPLNEGDRRLMGAPGCVRSRARSAGRQQRQRGCKIYSTPRERYNYGYVGVATVVVANVAVVGMQSAEARGRREEGARETESEYWTGWQQDAGRFSVTASSSALRHLPQPPPLAVTIVHRQGDGCPINRTPANRSSDALRTVRRPLVFVTRIQI